MVLPLAALWLAARTSPEAIRRQYEELLHIHLGPLQLVFSLERWAAGLALATAFAAFLTRRAAGWAAGGLLAAVLLQAFGAPWMSHLYQLSTLPEFWKIRPAFAKLELQLSPQDRIFLVPASPVSTGFSFIAKTASLLRVPAIWDYEPLVSRRYAEFSVMLHRAAIVRNLNDAFLHGFGPQLVSSRRLLDLTATRFVVASPRFADAVSRIRPPLRPFYRTDDLSVWENPDRLPRAFYVPRVEVVADAPALLDRLANGADDLRQMAFVEEPLPSGFSGDAGTAVAPASAVRFARNDPEDVVVEVDAVARGFVVLTDQYFHGWVATVNGQPAPIARANYAFRLVEVPAGRSTVEFRYRPRSLQLGACLSLASALAVVFLLVRSPRRRIASMS